MFLHQTVHVHLLLPTPAAILTLQVSHAPMLPSPSLMPTDGNINLNTELSLNSLFKKFNLMTGDSKSTSQLLEKQLFTIPNMTSIPMVSSTALPLTSLSSPLPHGPTTFLKEPLFMSSTLPPIGPDFNQLKLLPLPRSMSSRPKAINRMSLEHDQQFDSKYRYFVLIS